MTLTNVFRTHIEPNRTELTVFVLAKNSNRTPIFLYHYNVTTIKITSRTPFKVKKKLRSERVGLQRVRSAMFTDMGRNLGGLKTLIGQMTVAAAFTTYTSRHNCKDRQRQRCRINVIDTAFSLLRRQLLSRKTSWASLLLHSFHSVATISWNVNLQRYWCNSTFTEFLIAFSTNLTNMPIILDPQSQHCLSSIIWNSHSSRLVFLGVMRKKWIFFWTR